MQELVEKDALLRLTSSLGMRSRLSSSLPSCPSWAIRKDYKDKRAEKSMVVKKNTSLRLGMRYPVRHP